MSKKVRMIALALAGFLLLSVLVYQIPNVKSAVDWRTEKFGLYVKNVLNPPGPVPTALPTTVLRGPEATEERLLSLTPGHRILHFATHGSLAKDPLDSALVLASGPLTVERIAGLDALRGRIALVFLSACRSATEVGSGEADSISLAEGFAMAGVPTLIASLWDVDDRATRALVEAFYRALAVPGQDTLGALRAAQLEVLAATVDGARPFADPRFWSAFQLFGDFR